MYIQRARFSAIRRPAIIFSTADVALRQTIRRHKNRFFFYFFIIIIDFFLHHRRIISLRATVVVRARSNIHQQRSVKRIDARKSLNTPCRLFSRATKTPFPFLNVYTMSIYICLIIYNNILQQYIIYGQVRCIIQSVGNFFFTPTTVAANFCLSSSLIYIYTYIYIYIYLHF